MHRYGALAQAMRPMGKDDIFFARLNLLIVMAKAFLKQYPLGTFRARAIEENAQSVFHEALARAAQTIDPASRPDSAVRQDHLFFQRAQLLAVMCKSIVEGTSLDDYRREALLDTIEGLCAALSDPIALGEIQILKVA